MKGAPSVAVVDYGAGNLTSVLRALRAAGGDPAIATTPGDLANAGGIVLPGVGHFAATRTLDDAWRRAIRTSTRPLLGICLGMQLLFDASDEAPDLPGLGMLDGRVVRLTPGEVASAAAAPIKVPHVGWNTLDIVAPAAALDGIAPGTAMYFTHGYAVAASPCSMAVTTHGRRFTSVVVRDRVWGVQFHPEKSGEAGLRLLANWIGQCSASA